MTLLATVPINLSILSTLPCNLKGKQVQHHEEKLLWESRKVKDTHKALKKHAQKARCLKITEKVSFNIACEASYVYILSGQKLIKNAKNVPFWASF